MKVHRVKVKPFPGTVYVLIGTIDDITEELKRREIRDYNKIFTPGTDAAAVSVETPTGNAIAVLITPDVDDLTIWHECLHAAWYVLDIFGVHITVDNHEALAYMQGHIFEEIKKRMK
jgi:hypothetical protein